MIYVTQAGDTLESISRRFYGTGDRAGTIRAANPGLTTPLRPGQSIQVPPNPTQPENNPQPLPADSVDEVAVLIDGERFRFWESVEIRESIDAPADVSFISPFDPDDAAFREAFRPFRFPPLAVTVGGERLFTGTLVNVKPNIGNSSITVDVSGYARCGLLADVTVPASAYPAEYEDLDLRQWAQTLGEPFGIAPVFEQSPGSAFDQAAVEPGQTIWSFLTDLAQQRNLVIGSDAQGRPLFWQSRSGGTPVARLEQGSAPVTGVEAQFRSQDYYSHVTAIKEPQFWGEPQQYTEKNPFDMDQLRPHVFEPRDVEAGDVPQAASAKLGRMFANVAQWTVSVVGWRDPNGDLWRPNTTVSLRAPGAMIYDEHRFLVREVVRTADENSRTTSMVLVLPGAFAGETPEVLPWV